MHFKHYAILNYFRPFFANFIKRKNRQFSTLWLQGVKSDPSVYVPVADVAGGVRVCLVPAGAAAGVGHVAAPGHRGAEHRPGQAQPQGAALR